MSTSEENAPLRRLVNWLVAFAIPPMAFLCYTLLLFHTGWDTQTNENLYEIRNPGLWLTFFIPSTLLIYFIGQRFPKRRVIINWAFFIGMTIGLFFLMSRIES